MPHLLSLIEDMSYTKCDDFLGLQIIVLEKSYFLLTRCFFTMNLV